MFETLVVNDFKGRFKNTALGYFWHLLNPLTQILIYILIFTVVFGKDIPNYWVYLSSGMFAFSFFLRCSSMGCLSIVGNTNLVTKMTFAREILPMATCASSLVSFIISYLLLIILMVVSGVGVTISIFYLIPVILLYCIFCLGVAYILSALTVYLRDISNAVNVLFGCLMFAIPIMYIPSQMDNPLLEMIWAVNPMYYFIEVIHDCMYYGTFPDLFEFAMCAIFAVVMLILGLFVFKKLECGFAERL